MKDELQNKNQTNKKQNSINRNRIYSKRSGKEIKDSKNILEKKDPLNDDSENETELKDFPRTQIQIAEIIVTTRNNNLDLAKKTAIDIIKNKSVRNYLRSFERKKIISKASYID